MRGAMSLITHSHRRWLSGIEILSIGGMEKDAEPTLWFLKLK
jgi:hypothetical protein